MNDKSTKPNNKCIKKTGYEKTHSLTGFEMKPSSKVKNNILAMTEFKRIKEQYSAWGYDDDLFSGSVNMYCIQISEIEEDLAFIKKINRDLKELKHIKNEIILDEYDALKSSMILNRRDMKKIIIEKRNLQQEIAKEIFITVKDSFRIIKPHIKNKTDSEL